MNMKTLRFREIVGISASTVLLFAGPAKAAAPMVSVFGSYFPTWLICTLLGIVLTVIVRKLFIIVGINEHLPLAPVVYLCLTIAASIGIWLVWTGEIV